MTFSQHVTARHRVAPNRRLSICSLVCIPLLGTLLATGCGYTPSLTKDHALSVWKAAQPDAPATVSATTPRTAMSQTGAIALAMQGNRVLMDMRAQIPMSRARIDLAGKWNDPELRITDIALDDLIDGEPTLELALRFPIEEPGSLRTRETLRELSHRDLLARIEAYEHRLSVEIRRVFNHLAMLQLDRTEVEKEIQIRQGHLELVKKRLEAGVGVEVDLPLAELPHARALDEREVLVAKERTLHAKLAKLVGITTSGPLALPTLTLEPPAARQRSSNNSLIERALVSRPELDQAMLRLEQAKAKSFIAERRQWPWPDFAQLSYEIRHPLQPLRYGFALALKIPIFEWTGERMNLHQAEIELRKTEEESLIRSIEQQVRDATAHVDMLRTRLSNLQTTLIPATVASSSAVQRALEAGTLDPLRATVIEGRRIRSKRRYLKVLADYYDALFDLESAIGPSSKVTKQRTSTLP